MIDEKTLIEYEVELSSDFIKMPSLYEMFRLKPGKTVRSLDNMELRIDLLLYVWNPYTKQYYPRRLHNCTDKLKLEQYFIDGNLYINKNDLIWSKS